jgi:hypothetical protein
MSFYPIRSDSMDHDAVPARANVLSIVLQPVLTILVV